MDIRSNGILIELNDWWDEEKKQEETNQFHFGLFKNFNITLQINLSDLKFLYIAKKRPDVKLGNESSR